MTEEVEILLVEDKESDRELALRALKKAKIANKIHTVKDGADALDFVFCQGTYSKRMNEPLPSVILLDLKLPKLSGVDVIERLKSDDRTKSIPIVVLTSSRESKDVKDCYKLGVNSYIVKPVDFNQFSTALSSIGMYWLAVNVNPPVKSLNESGLLEN